VRRSLLINAVVGVKPASDMFEVVSGGTVIA
jgi:hypothetical protein